MNNKILVLGSGGLVGSRFLEVSEFKDLIHNPRQIELDITNRNELEAVLKSFDIDVIVNFAAYTNVNEAEKQRGDRKGSCWQTNVEGVEHIAKAIKNSKKPIDFILISTSKVFSGTKSDPGPYKENHPTEKDLKKLTWYGYTKARGEDKVREILRENISILRLSVSVRAKYSKKTDLLRNAVTLYDQGKLYPMFKDQQMTITFIDEVVKTIDNIIRIKKHGIYHVSSVDTTTPYELVSYLIEKVRTKKNVVIPITVREYLKKTSKPTYRHQLYDGLSVKETEKQLGIKFRTWKQIVDELIKQGLGK